MRYAAAVDGSTGLLHLSDEAGGIEASVAPAHGAELSSLRYRHEGEYIEALYRGNDFTEPE
ncbi:MAG: hypothetical protein ACE5JM_08250, partial [Armatimonadota bacterium]